ncbi:hypothetical protein BKA70DRAFT_1241628 [Coprinopsis sp. MPI-PUGE-AT-0042]|nr:hypothetical protein BKA70DRAFT_1241628 [Coprinopsis sp. MPI-PUGE-AT-0042]
MLSLWLKYEHKQFSRRNDEEMAAISARIVLEHEEQSIQGLPTAIRHCMLYGAGCSAPLRVALSAHSGYENQCRPWDLHVEAYTDRQDMEQSNVISLNDTFRTMTVDGLDYCIVADASSRGSPENKLLRDIVEEGSRLRWGNVLVIKTCDGVAVDFGVDATVPAEAFRMWESIVHYADFETLTHLTSPHSVLKAQSHTVLVQRLRNTLSRFIPASHIDLFLMLLQQYSGAVIGYAALDFLLQPKGNPVTVKNDITWVHQPYSTLEVAIGGDSKGLGDFQRFFSLIGFHGIEDQMPDSLARGAVSAVYGGTRFGESVEENLEVELSVGFSTSFSAVLDTRATFMMNAIMIDRVYCFYPDLTLQRREGLRRWTVQDVVELACHEDNSHWDAGQCEVYCPLLRRKTSDSGILVKHLGYYASRLSHGNWVYNARIQTANGGEEEKF